MGCCTCVGPFVCCLSAASARLGICKRICIAHYAPCPFACGLGILRVVLRPKVREMERSHGHWPLPTIPVVQDRADAPAEIADDHRSVQHAPGWCFGSIFAKRLCSDPSFHSAFASNFFRTALTFALSCLLKFPTMFMILGRSTLSCQWRSVESRTECGMCKRTSALTVVRASLTAKFQRGE